MPQSQGLKKKESKIMGLVVGWDAEGENKRQVRARITSGQIL